MELQKLQTDLASCQLTREVQIQIEIQTQIQMKKSPGQPPTDKKGANHPPHSLFGQTRLQQPKLKII